MSAADVLNGILDELEAVDQRFAASIILGYLWSEASPEVREASVAAMRRHVKSPEATRSAA